MTDETTDAADHCCGLVQDVVRLARRSALTGHERRTLLDALGHGDCVPREQYAKAVAAYQAEAQRAEHAEDERDALRDALRFVRDHAVGALTRAARRERS